MDARTGKKIRLGRILNPVSGRTIIVAASHAVLTGAPTGLKNVSEMRNRLGQLAGANGIMLAPGSVEKIEDIFVGREKPSLVIHMDWKSFGRPLFTPGADGISEGNISELTTVENAVSCGADAIMTYLYVGHKDNNLEKEEVQRNARLAAECAKYGIVLIIEPRAVNDSIDKTQVENPKLLSWYCRMAAEIGADVVKCIWPGDTKSYEKIVNETTVPTVLAGGSASDDRILETMELAQSTVQAGGAGVMFGRRIYSSVSPAAVLAGLSAVVHEGADAKTGVKIFSDLTSKIS
jgi:class I fructose-bisphosphate aldolase